MIRTGKITVNLDAKTVDVGGQTVHLTGKEYQMLELLSLRKGTTLTKEMFLNHLYGGMDEPELKIIDVFICKLRKKLAEATGDPSYIETVWGRGYVLRDPDTRQATDKSRRRSALGSPSTCPLDHMPLRRLSLARQRRRRDGAGRWRGDEIAVDALSEAGARDELARLAGLLARGEYGLPRPRRARS